MFKIFLLCRLGSLFFMLLYLSMISLSSLPVWRDEKLLFIRCCPASQVTDAVPLPA